MNANVKFANHDFNVETWPGSNQEKVAHLRITSPS